MLAAHALLGNSQRLDGGAMFGNVPRALWTRWCEPDELGRIDLACRCLLIDDGRRKLLFETGIGAFFEPSLRERYGVVEEQHVLLESLAALGLSDADVDVVVLSHLHFDHAGGLLAPHDGGPPRLLFPNAKFLVGREAWQRARAPHPRDRASFIAELPGRLEQSGRLELAEGAEHPLLGASFRLRYSSGHTPGMLLSQVRGRARSLFFCADLVPGKAWVHLPITMGYDRFPEQLIDEKAALYAELNAETPETWLFFTHDSQHAAARLARGDKGRWTAAAPLATLAGLDLDDLDAT